MLAHANQEGTNVSEKMKSGSTEQTQQMQFKHDGIIPSHFNQALLD